MKKCLFFNFKIGVKQKNISFKVGDKVFDNCGNQYIIVYSALNGNKQQLLGTKLGKLYDLTNIDIRQIGDIDDSLVNKNLSFAIEKLNKLREINSFIVPQSGKQEIILK